MAIMLLIADGRLRLDERVRDLLPALPAYTRDIRIRHLLHHTSGLRAYQDFVRESSTRHVKDRDVPALLHRTDALMYSSVRDLVAWDRALDEHRLVDARLTELAWTPGRLDDGTPTRYGFGWFIDRDSRGRVRERAVLSPSPVSHHPAAASGDHASPRDLPIYRGLGVWYSACCCSGRRQRHRRAERRSGWVAWESSRER
jgi:CubicO group peptidase (beta-lactamase class C family)